MKKLIVFLILLMGVSSLYAQTVYMIENPTTGKSETFTTFDEAQNALERGDFFYLPSGIIEKSTFTFSTPGITIIGGGYREGPQATLLKGNVYIKADSITLTGCRLSSSLHLGSTLSSDTATYHNIHITRCRYSSLNFGGSQSNNKFVNTIISECILSYVYGYGAKPPTLFYANIIIDKLSNFYGPGIFFYFNNFLEFSSDVLNTPISHCHFYNNIFNTFPHYSNNRFENNLINSSIYFPVPTAYKEYGSDYYFNTDTFTVYRGGRLANYHDSLDFHLPDSHPANAGIYKGGFKEDGSPLNPLLELLEMPVATDKDGNLNIKIKAKARKY